MINVVKTKLENKTDKQFIYYIGSSKIILDPGKPVIIGGDIFTRETRQEGNTEGLLVNIYNGNIDFTLIVDDKFVTKIERDAVVSLPQRSQSRLIDKTAKPEVKAEPKKEEPKPAAKEEPKKEEVKPVVKEEVKVEPKKEEVKVEPKKEEPKQEAKPAKEEPASLNDITVEDAKTKTKKVTKL